ncbi:hypothetical protein PFISCL1PPCAC_7497, partial [Pristionchus fissidentatus]
RFLEEFIPIRIIGEGAFGIVYEAEHRLTKLKYAVKRVHIKPNLRLMRRARREATMLANLDHPGIVRYQHSCIEKPPPGWQTSRWRFLLQSANEKK